MALQFSLRPNDCLNLCWVWSLPAAGDKRAVLVLGTNHPWDSEGNDAKAQGICHCWEVVPQGACWSGPSGGLFLWSERMCTLLSLPKAWLGLIGCTAASGRTGRLLPQGAAPPRRGPMRVGCSSEAPSSPPEECSLNGLIHVALGQRHPHLPAYKRSPDPVQARCTRGHGCCVLLTPAVAVSHCPQQS